ncbi:MAG: hypothetical protein NZM07_09155 [Elioraea sp.]|nr:hypothetical protein [Elioraea sp.]
MNGVVSATMNDHYADLSVPAEVGRCLAPPPAFRPFERARYPRPVLVDVEALARHYLSAGDSLSALAQLVTALPAIKRSVADNARSWLNDLDHQQEAIWDNLAIAGARLPDVFSVNLGHVRDRLAAMKEQIESNNDPLAWGGPLPANDPSRDDHAFDSQPPPPQNKPLLAMSDLWSVMDVHLTLNAAHLMGACPELRQNPGGSVLDVVRARKPPILLMSMGPNHGLPDISMRTDLARRLARLERFAELWPKCAEKIAELPGLRLFVMMLLPDPSLVPALMPPFDGNTNPSPPASGQRYHSQYVSALTLSQLTVLPGSAVQDADRRVAAVRKSVREATVAAFAQARKRRPKLRPPRFVDMSDILARYDTKHGRGRVFVPDPTSQHAPDRYGYGNWAIGQKAGGVRGGICSLDHFHPTTLGYRYLAREIVNIIIEEQEAIGMPNLVRSLPLVTTLGDSLLSNPSYPAFHVLTNFWPKTDAGGHVFLGVPVGSAENQGGRALFNSGGCPGR